MTLVAQTSSQLVALFDEDVKNKVIEIYQAVPGSLVKYLEKQEIVKRVSFRQDFAASQIQMGTKKQVNFVDFERSLRNTIHESFGAHTVTELHAEDLSAAISAKYQNQKPSRADPGKSVSAIVSFNQAFQKKEGAFWTNVNAYVYIYIEEECENNWFAQDKRKFRYELTIELNGIAVDKNKALDFSQRVARGSVQEAINALETKYAITWDNI